jgi:hypothetical protein
MLEKIDTCRGEFVNYDKNRILPKASLANLSSLASLANLSSLASLENLASVG